MINTKNSTILLGIMLLCLTTIAQDYDNYIGAGSTNGVTVTASSSFGSSDPMATIDGSGLDAKKMEAARFLSQATFGGTLDDVDNLLAIGYDQWFVEQAALPVTPFTSKMEEIWDFIYNGYISAGYAEEDIYGPSVVNFNYTWWENAITQDDQLRQRLAFALSQILVISSDSDLTGYAEALTTYYELLMNHGLGNYKDLLLEVSLNPSMGFYLSSLNNPKSDPPNNTFPDENYAREIMQLFTIGLYELGIDGIPLEDANGDWIPTYDNADIKELAKVFTGLGVGDINMYVDWTDTPYFGLGIWGADMTVPMIMYEEWHEQGPKVLLGGDYTIPSGQTGMEDIEDAVDFLFNHDNVGPFISRQLIQRMVKSNPTPGYIQRVAEVFNDNGEGVRGDLLAVAKAILLDEEARGCADLQDPDNGKLREPTLVLMQLMRSLPIVSLNGNYWNNGFDLMNETAQMPLASPTVFNFFTPNYIPNGPISDAGLVAPEFQIFNTLTSVGYINKVHDWTLWNYLIYDWESNDVFGDDHVFLDDAFLTSAITDEGTEGLLNDLDILFTNGQLTDEWRQEIRTAVNTLNWGEHTDAMLMIYLLLISPDYMIAK